MWCGKRDFLVDPDLLLESDYCQATNCSKHWELRWQQAEQDIKTATQAKEMATEAKAMAVTKSDRRRARLEENAATVALQRARDSKVSIWLSQHLATKAWISRNNSKAADELKKKKNKQKECIQELAEQARCASIIKRLKEYDKEAKKREKYSQSNSAELNSPKEMVSSKTYSPTSSIKASDSGAKPQSEAVSLPETQIWSTPTPASPSPQPPSTPEVPSSIAPPTTQPSTPTTPQTPKSPTPQFSSTTQYSTLTTPISSTPQPPSTTQPSTPTTPQSPRGTPKPKSPPPEK
ncbi:hypothetical protein O0L34_g5572 [Tuta absoluta]|nr:hypothetical protein O0L34_g5572 [Tuta absoluta]